MEEGRGKVGITWSRITFTVERDPDGEISGTFWRPFNVDISDCQALRVQVSIQQNATLGMSAKIDAEIREVFQPQPGIVISAIAR